MILASRSYFVELNDTRVLGSESYTARIRFSLVRGRPGSISNLLKFVNTQRLSVASEMQSASSDAPGS